MKSIIDVALNVAAFADELKSAGVQTVIRYYNHRNSAKLPTKCLSRDEASTLAGAGLSLAVVFQQGGGANGAISELTRESGLKDAERALALAEEVGQPAGSAIYFAVDHDYVKHGDLASILAYFAAVREKLAGRYEVGCYGSGTVGGAVKSAGLADHVWLSGSIGWSGTKAMLATDRWTLFQRDLEQSFQGLFRYDGNEQSPAHAGFGQFLPGGAALPPPARTPAPALMEVIARDGLRLRGGPGTEFGIIKTLARGTVVEAVGQTGDWVEVDLEGDGAKDGFVHKGFVRPLSGGLVTPPAAGATPYDIAKDELARGVVEAPGNQDNPRIVLYHSTTTGGAAADEIAWCSSFMNFCVEQAGLRGTDNKWAKSWHDTNWGTDVTGSPREGDIAVFERRRGSANGEIKGGHVGFWVLDRGDRIRLLGGNQSNRVGHEDYPKGGLLGENFYRLLSVRRG